MENLDKRLTTDVNILKGYRKKLQQIGYGRKSDPIKRLINSQHAMATRICQDCSTELKIMEDHLDVLSRVTENTYWVFNISTKDEYKKLVSRQRAICALYRRKLKSMKTHLESITFYARETNK